MDQRDIVLTKQWVIRLPADGEVTSQAAINPGKKGIGLPLGMLGEMLVRPFGISWVDLVRKEINGRCEILSMHALDS